MKALVTGGGGFLGQAVVKLLFERGWDVRTLCRGDYPALSALGVEARRGDIGCAQTVEEAVRGCDAVFHVAARAGVWGPRASYRRTNVTGTLNVIAGCRKHGTKKLIYTSTPSVVHGGGDLEGVDESVPYATRFTAHYPCTKAEAERAVLAANGPDLCTIALRPHLIWGPGDNHLAPRIVARQRAGALRLVGDGTNLIDTVYVDDAAAAHLQACERLEPGAPCSGKAYFISAGDPRPTAEILNRILASAGLPPVTKTVSPRVAWLAGLVMEGVYGLLRVKREPRMTRFLAHQLSTAHWYDIGAARRDLGYEPKVSIEEGMRRLAAWFASQAAPQSAG